MNVLSLATWFDDWGWIVLVSMTFLLVCGVIIFALKKQQNEKNIEKNKKQNNTFLKIFGGEDNIISCEARGSRLVLVLKDYDLLDENKLKENGVTSLIKATNKVTLIIGEKSKELEDYINENKRS